MALTYSVTITGYSSLLQVLRVYFFPTDGGKEIWVFHPVNHSVHPKHTASFYPWQSNPPSVLASINLFLHSLHWCLSLYLGPLHMSHLLFLITLYAPLEIWIHVFKWENKFKTKLLIYGLSQCTFPQIWWLMECFLCWSFYFIVASSLNSVPLYIGTKEIGINSNSASQVSSLPRFSYFLYMIQK